MRILLLLCAFLISWSSAAFAAGTVTVSWSASTDNVGGAGVGGYNLRKCQGACCTPTLTLTSRPANTVSYVDTAVSAGLTYCYSVNAFDLSAAVNQSAFSAPFCITTIAVVPGALAIDAVSSSIDNRTSNTTNWLHPIGNGNNRIYLGCAAARSTVQSSVAVSTMTIGGLAMTKIRHDERFDGAAYIRTEWWYRVAPAVGSQSSVVTWGGTPSSFGVASGISLTEVDQAAPIDANAGANGNSGTLSADITTVAANAWIVDCPLSKQNLGLTVGAGQTSRANRIVGALLDSVGLSTVNGKAVPGIETMDWTTSGGTEHWTNSVTSIKPAAAPVPPSITGMVVDATGVNLTYGGTTPTTVRFSTDFVASQLVPIGSIPGGRYTWAAPIAPLSPNLSFICAWPINGAGVENANPDDHKCVGPPPPVAIDTEPPVISNGLPATILPVGTTQWDVSATVNKPCLCRADTTNVAYALMSISMSVVNLTASTTALNLSNGLTRSYYIACDFIDTNGVSHVTPTSTLVTVAVDTVTADSTRPSTVTSLQGTDLGQSQVQLTWPGATDNILVSGYLVFQSLGANNTVFTLNGSPTTLTTTVVGTAQNQIANYCVKAIDSSNNLSAACSPTYTIITSNLFDATAPSSVPRIEVAEAQFDRVILQWPTVSDNLAVIGGTIEWCKGMGCNVFTFNASSQNPVSATALGLEPWTQYTFRAQVFDASGNVSATKSPTFIGTTGAASGTTGGVILDPTGF